LIQETGALDVYFEESIEILVAEPAAFRAGNIGAVLEANQIAFSRIEERAL
jgi:hypothetical protein